MNGQAVIFGGTTEGRKIARRLADNAVDTRLFVATGYGEELVSPQPHLRVTARRLSAEEMAREIGACPLVIDATHPYAREVTENIREACAKTGTELIRLVRETWTPENVIEAANAREAAGFLNSIGEKAMLAIGSKELGFFTDVRNYRERLFVRVLPSAEALQKCTTLGFPNERLICMQGPFSRELNAAMIRMTGVRYLVTKDSGYAGGLYEKIAAARETDCKVILIKRPITREDGLNFKTLMRDLERRFQLAPEVPSAMDETAKRDPLFFPLFVNLAGKLAVIVGGGNIAARRIRILLRFGAKIRVIAPELCEDLQKLFEQGKIEWIQSKFAPELLGEADIAIAATNSRDANRLTGETAKQRRILCSVADNRGECGFYFPAVADTDNFIAGIVSKDNDHDALKNITKKIRAIRGDTL